jgi:antitoxin HicB
MTRRYTVLLTQGPEGSGYTVRVPALPGCTSQGRTVAEATEHAREAIELHIRCMAEDSEEIPEDIKDVQLAKVDVAA